MVLSAKVSAFKKVCMEVLSRFTKGSFTGKRSLPQRTECSKMWKTPLSFAGGVLKAMAKDLFSSSHASQRARAPLAVCLIAYATPDNSGKGRTSVTTKPEYSASFVRLSMFASIYCSLYLYLSSNNSARDGSGTIAVTGARNLHAVHLCGDAGIPFLIVFSAVA